MSKLSMHLMKCPNCGAHIEEVPTSGTFRCPYCRMTVLVEKQSEAARPADTLPPPATSKDADALAQSGIQAYLDDKHEKAVKHLEAALQGRPKNNRVEELFTILGNAQAALHLHEKAVASHRKALEINPRYHKAWVNLGISQRHLGDMVEAERCYMEAIRIKPDYAELHASLGALHIFRGDAERAIESCRTAVKLDPTVATAHGNLALAYAMDGQFEAADRSLKQAVILGYSNAKTLRRRIEELRMIEEGEGEEEDD